MMFWIGIYILLAGTFIICLCKISARADNFGKKDDDYYG